MATTVETRTPLIEITGASKSFGNVMALDDISMAVYAGEVHCLLGDNGAGKSTLIKILSGVHAPDRGELRVDGKPVRFGSPRHALGMGIATAYQDLAMIPLMSISRNFFLGSEPTKGWGPFRRFDVRAADEITRAELTKMGIAVRDTSQPVGTLSAREQGLGVIFITHNAHHAWAIGDRFTLLNRGRSMGTFRKEETTREEVIAMMAGGAALEDLEHELGQNAPPAASR